MKTIVALVALMTFLVTVKLVFRYIYKTKSSVTLKFIHSIVILVGVTVIVYTYLSQFEITKEVSKTLLQSGSLIIAIATFSCQQVLGNIISGFVISSTKPFDIGDKITLLSTGGSIVVEGIVTDMNARHVVFKKADGRFDFVTNSIVDSCIVENSNVLEDNGRLFMIECSYDSDVELAIKLMQKEIDNCPLTIKKDIPAAKVLCSRLNPNGYELKVTIWTNDIDDSFVACSQLRINIARVWGSHNIKIPYNTVTILSE